MLLGRVARQRESSMLRVDPNENVTLSSSGGMSAYSAVRKVMLEWSTVDRRQARIAKEVVICREGNPSTLNVADIEELWSRPEFWTVMKRYFELFYHVTGLILLFAVKCKHVIRGYKTPKPIAMKDEECIRYDIHIADAWLDALARYTDRGRLSGADVLELGPGSDLGTGLYLISKGARTYCAIDAIDLAGSVPREFYEKLIDRIAGSSGTCQGTTTTQSLSEAMWGPKRKVDYVVNSHFDVLGSLDGRSFDIIVSNAAFEHFNNIEQALAEISAVARKGAILVCCIDLMTHTRWIRQRDPNNIYRYPDWLYGLAKFTGIPNRVRPHQYKFVLEKNGWKDVVVIPDLRLYGFDARHLAKRFLDPVNEMEFLTITICATKAA
jgi:SAM-dependent methyltransferase